MAERAETRAEIFLHGWKEHEVLTLVVTLFAGVVLGAIAAMFPHWQAVAVVIVLLSILSYLAKRYLEGADGRRKAELVLVQITARDEALIGAADDKATAISSAVEKLRAEYSEDKRQLLAENRALNDECNILKVRIEREEAEHELTRQKMP